MPLICSLGCWLILLRVNQLVPEEARARAIWIATVLVITETYFFGVILPDS